MRIVNSLEESDLLIKPLEETIGNEAKEQKMNFLAFLFSFFFFVAVALGAILLGNLLARKGVTGEGTD